MTRPALAALATLGVSSMPATGSDAAGPPLGTFRTRVTELTAIFGSHSWTKVTR
jgi:hypothetical protein